MPGLAVVHASRPSAALLAGMMAALRHRAPIASGLFGDRRSGPCRIAFSGRLYNRREILSRFSEPVPGTVSDADIVLRIYERVQERCVEALDGSFAFVVDDPACGLFAARDALGSQPLYLGTRGDQLLFASEMKAFPADVEEFAPVPPGCTYRVAEGPRPFPTYPDPSGPDVAGLPWHAVLERLADLLDRAVVRRLGRRSNVGVLLSGGLDSSIVAALAALHLPYVDTFAVGTKDGEDLAFARLCAEHLGTRHRDLVYGLDVCLDVLPHVIRSLESFDAPLVRSAVPNYLAARLASGKVEVLLSGEGADELFAGYAYMLGMTLDERDAEIRDVLGTLHNTGLQRGDRMASAFGLEVHAPFLDEEVRRFALAIPVKDKTGPAGEEKWPLRQAFSDLLPESILMRRKQKFSVGAGSSLLLARWAEETIGDEEFVAEALTAGGRRLTDKEELLYYRIFRKHFPSVHAERAIGFSRSR